MKVQLVCKVMRLQYVVTLRGYITWLCVQLVTPYRITHLQCYTVTLQVCTHPKTENHFSDIPKYYQVSKTKQLYVIIL